MTTATDTSPAEKLLALVTDSTILTDEERELFVAELLEGRIHPDLSAKLEALCDAEIAVSTADIESLHEEIAAQDAAIESAQAEDDTEATKLVRDYEGELADTVTHHKEDVARLERTVDKEIEGDVRHQKDEPEVDAIRAMLKEKPAA